MLASSALSECEIVRGILFSRDQLLFLKVERSGRDLHLALSLGLDRHVSGGRVQHLDWKNSAKQRNREAPTEIMFVSESTNNFTFCRGEKHSLIA